MAEETKKTTTAKAKVEKPIEVPKQEVDETAEVVSTVTTKIADPSDLPDLAEAEEDVVEALGKRGRKSKAEIQESIRRTREDFESNYENLIDHEPHKADFYREELRQKLKEMNLL